MSGPRRICCAADIVEGAAWLSAREPAFARVLPELSPLPLRLQPEGFATLLRAIVGQQISTAAAGAIFARLEAAGFTDPGAIRAAGADALRGCGLSRPKARLVLALAERAPELDRLARLGDAEARAALVALPGVGPWTADIYLLSALGRPDVLPAADIALREAARRLFGLPARPSPRELAGMGAAWAPWRAVAARALWAYYRRELGREGV